MTKLIKAECNNEYPFCVHYAFLIGDTVIHNTPDRENFYGGNIVTEKWIDFLSKRNVYSIEDIDTKAEKIWDYLDRNKTKKFNPITYNCEQFANDVMTGVKSSSLLTRWLFLVGFTYVLIKKIKKS